MREAAQGRFRAGARGSADTMLGTAVSWCDLEAIERVRAFAERCACGRGAA